MHDAQLLSNAEVTREGQRVTDLIIEIRDDCKQRQHFMPCPRNTKGILVSVIKHIENFYSAFRTRNIFRTYEIISRVLSRYTSDHYYYPSRGHSGWALLGFTEVNDLIYVYPLKNCFRERVLKYVLLNFVDATMKEPRQCSLTTICYLKILKTLCEASP